MARFKQRAMILLLKNNALSNEKKCNQEHIYVSNDWTFDKETSHANFYIWANQATAVNIGVAWPWD